MLLHWEFFQNSLRRTCNHISLGRDYATDLATNTPVHPRKSRYSTGNIRTKKEKTLSFRKSLLFFTETTERPKISAILLSYEFVAAVVPAAATTLRNAVGTSISSGFYSSPN